MRKSLGSIALVVIVATLFITMVLLWLHKSTQVELQLMTSRIDFTVYDPQRMDSPVRLVSDLSGSSFKLRNFERVEIEVERLWNLDAPSQPPLENKWIVIKPSESEFSRLTLKGRNLTLANLFVPPNAEIALDIDEEGSIKLWVIPETGDSDVSRVGERINGAISIAGSVEALVERCEVVDENGEVLFSEAPQRKLLIDLGEGADLYYRSDSTMTVSVDLTDESETERVKTLGIYDPADDSWTIKRAALPIYVPNAVTLVADGKIYLIEGVSSSDRERGITLLRDDLYITCVSFSGPSVEDPLREILTPIKEGSIVFTDEKLDEIKLRCEFLKFKEDDTFQLLNTSVKNGQLRLLLVGMPKSILAGSQPETLREKRPTYLEWLYVNPKTAMVIGILLGSIGFVKPIIEFIKALGARVSDSRRRKSNRGSN